MTGSSYVPIIVPIVAFLAMALWLGLIFYADSHPGYSRRKPQPVDDLVTAETSDTASAADGPERHALPDAPRPARAA